MQLPLLSNMPLPKHLAKYLELKNFYFFIILIMRRKNIWTNAFQTGKLTTVALHIGWYYIITVYKTIHFGSD